MQIGYSVQRGARRASSSLVPRLAPRGFPVRRGWRGGERQGWRVSAVRKGGGCAGCEKGHGRGRVTFPPLGSVLTSHRSDSRSGTKWWGAASLPHIARIPGPARNVGARRPYPTSIRFPVQRGWWGGSGMQKGTSTGYGRRCALASARMTGRGILPHVDRAPGSAGMVGRERDAKRHEHRVWAAVCAGERTGWQGKKKRRCALASARGGGAGILPPRRSGSRFSAGRRGEERARCGPTRLNAIRPALFVRGDSLWIPAATYLPGPSPAKYCRRMRA